MTIRAFVIGCFAVCAVGCTSPAGGPGVGGTATTASFKGAKIRVLNLSSSAADATLNGTTLGEGIPIEGTSVFRLSAFKKPGKVTVGPHEFSVPLKGSTAFTVVYMGTGDATIISGEPTEIAGGMSVVYFHSIIDGGSGQTTSLKPGVGNETSVAFAESKVVSPGSYEATVKLSSGKEASVTVDLEAGDAVTILLMGTSSAPKLIVLKNDTRMTVGGFGGSSPTG